MLLKNYKRILMLKIIAILLGVFLLGKNYILSSSTHTQQTQPIVLIIDLSSSMDSIYTRKTTYIEQTKIHIQTALKELPIQQEIGVIGFSNQERLPIIAPTTKHLDLAKTIDTLHTSLIRQEQDKDIPISLQDITKTYPNITYILYSDTTYTSLPKDISQASFSDSLDLKAQKDISPTISIEQIIGICLLILGSI